MNLLESNASHHACRASTWKAAPVTLRKTPTFTPLRVQIQKIGARMNWAIPSILLAKCYVIENAVGPIKNVYSSYRILNI